ECQQKKNPTSNPGIEHREDNALQVMNRDATDLLHAMREHGIASRGKHGHSGQDKTLAKVHWGLGASNDFYHRDTLRLRSGQAPTQREAKEKQDNERLSPCLCASVVNCSFLV